MQSAGRQSRHHDGNDRKHPGSAWRDLPLFSRARHVAHARCVHTHAGGHEGFHARQHPGSRGPRDLSPGVEPEAFDHHLFCADDESGLLACAGPGSVRHPDSDGRRYRDRCVARLTAKDRRRHMIRRLYVVVAIVSFGLVFVTLAIGYTEQQSLRPLAESYVRLVPQSLGAPNVITGILLTYRGFDTLGEVAVLFMVAASIGLVLGTERSQRTVSPEDRRPSSEIVRTGTEILVPLISIFAAYIIMNGHLSAGGGFQGGAVIASGVLLMLLAYPHYQPNLEFLSVTESVAGTLFVLVGIVGLIVAGGFLDNHILPLGQFGAFFSAGAIPLLSVLLGIKVGCELSVILEKFRP